jgi:hypothetical protein
MSSTNEEQTYLSAPSPNPSNNGSNETFIDPSPIAPSSNGTEFTDLDEIPDHQHGNTSGPARLIRGQNHTLQQPELKVGEGGTAKQYEHRLMSFQTDTNIETFKTHPVSTPIRRGRSSSIRYPCSARVFRFCMTRFSPKTAADCSHH